MGLQHDYILEAGRVPVATEMMQAEIVVNSVDGKLYAKNSAETVFRMLTTLDRRSDVRAAGTTDDSVVTETGIRAAIDSAVAGPWAVSGANIYNTNAGNVGVKTTAPRTALEVYGKVLIGRPETYTASRSLAIGGNLDFRTISRPTNAQTLAMVLTNTGAGNIPPGTFYYGVVFYNEEGDTGGASAASLPSITLAEASQVTLSNIPVSSDPRVTGRKIYRSQTGAVGDFYYLYYVGTIANNTVTTYADNSAINTTSNDWIYNKNNTTAGIIYRDNLVFGRLADYVTAFGANALGSLTRGSTTAAFGTSALANVTTGGSNQAFGHAAGSSVTTGSSNVYMGYASGQGNQTGSNNVAIGENALRNNSSKSLASNTAIGAHALYELDTANNYNVGVGYFAGRGARGTTNTFIGNAAGYIATPTVVGSNNIVIGPNAADNLGSGSNNVIIGNSVKVPVPTASNQLNLGNVIYATGLATGLTPSPTGRVGIGTTAPGSQLDVAGTVTAYTAKLSAVGAVAAAQLLGLDASQNLTTNVLPLVLAGIHPHVAGLGLSGSAYNGSADVTWAVDFAGTGDSNFVARSNHNHDSQYSAIGHNHYLVSLADVLIDTLANGQVLMYNSTLDVWENVNSGGYWKRVGTVLSPLTANDRIEVTVTGSDTGVYGIASDGTGVYGVSGTGYGLRGTSTSNAGVYGYSNSGTGVSGTTAGGAGSAGVRAVASGGGFGLSAQATTSHAVTGNSTSGYGGYFISTNSAGVVATSTNYIALVAHAMPSDNSGLWQVLSLNRQTTGTAAAGIGIAIDFQIEQSSGVIQSQASFGAKLTSAGTVTSAFGFSLRKADASVSEVALMTPSDMSFKTDLGYVLRLKSHRNYTGVPGFLKSGDYLGSLTFDAWSSATTYASVAGIIATATADHDSTNYASKLEFWLMAASSSVPRQVGEFTPAGKLKGVFGFAVPGADGISGTSTIVTGVSYDSGTMTLTFTRSTLTVSGGIVTAVSSESNLVIPLSA